jgi:hypothetical protein
MRHQGRACLSHNDVVEEIIWGKWQTREAFVDTCFGELVVRQGLPDLTIPMVWWICACQIRGEGLDHPAASSD